MDWERTPKRLPGDSLHIGTEVESRAIGMYGQTECEPTSHSNGDVSRRLTASIIDNDSHAVGGAIEDDLLVLVTRQGRHARSRRIANFQQTLFFVALSAC